MRLAFLFFGASALCYAKPQNMAVIQGAADLSDLGCCIEVTTSDRTVLNWDSFSIDVHETARFIQPSADSSVLNRVVGPDLSQIMGLLQSNGQIYLVNPNGVLIGKEGRIDTAGFFAVCRDGDISHFGTIEAGNLEMSARNIEIEGTINMGGIVDANTISIEGGRAFLRAEEALTSSGNIQAERIHLFGKQIELQGGCLDASGEAGGGEILIGGDLTRKVPGALYAEHTTVAEGVAIRADALRSGDGGTVVVWANDATQFHGSLSAKALGETGDGGFAEVSGAKSVWITTHPDVRSSSGKAGTFLLDPGSVLINNSSSSGPNTFGNTYIATQLGLGNFTISTADATDGGAQTITFAASLSLFWTDTTLTLNAGQNIYAPSGANLQFTTGSLILETTQTPPAMQGYDGIYLNGVTIISTSSGNVTLSGVGGTSNVGSVTCNGVNLAGCTIGTSSGIVSITGTAGGDSTGGVDNIGVWINSASTVLGDHSGAINITGTGGPNAGGSSDSNSGIAITGSSSIQGITGSSIALLGTAGGSVNSTYGVSIDNSTLSIGASGALMIQGSGSTDDATSCAGVSIATGTGINLTNGPISISGSFDADNQSSNCGVLISGTTTIGSEAGNIGISGSVSGTGGSGNCGLCILSAEPGLITSENLGSVTLTGDASMLSGGNDNIGLSLTDFVTNSLNSPDLLMMGTGGSGSGSGNHGIYLPNAASTAGSQINTWTLNGTTASTGSANHGVWIHNLSTNSSFQTFLSIAGDTASSTDSYGVYIQGTDGDSVFDGVSVTTSASDAFFDCSTAASIFSVVEGISGVATGIDIDIVGNATITANTSELSTVFSATGSPSLLPISIAASGDITLNSIVGVDPLIKTIDSTGAIALQAGGVLTLGEQTVITGSGTSMVFQGASIAMAGTLTINAGGGTAVFDGPITVSSSSTIFSTGAALEFYDPISSSGGEHELLVNSNANAMTFSGDIGTNTAPFDFLEFETTEPNSGIVLNGVDVYTVFATFDGLTTVAGASVVNTSPGSQTFAAIAGNQNLTLIADGGSIIINGEVGSSLTPLGALEITTSAPMEGLTLSNGTIYASSVLFDTSVICTAGSCNINTGAGAVTFNGLVDGGSANWRVIGGDISLNSNLNTTTGNINFVASGAFELGNFAQFFTSSSMSAATLTVQAGSALTLGQSTLIQTTKGNILLIAGTNLTSGANATIQTTGSLGSITLVVDDAYPTPPSAGNGIFNLSSSTSISSSSDSGVVALYASKPGVVPINSFPSSVNGIAYAPGAYDTVDGVYIPGPNEMVGYWYNVAPIPSIATFGILYKVAPPIPEAMPLSTAGHVALVEPVVTLEKNMRRSIWLERCIDCLLRPNELDYQ